MKNLIEKMFGTKHERDVKKMQPLVVEINNYFEKLKSLSDEELQAKTDEFKTRLAEGETVDDIMAEAFAVVKETCRRHLGQTWDVVNQPTEWNMVPFDVQLIGAIALHQGKIAEMATGEGKTLLCADRVSLFVGGIRQRASGSATRLADAASSVKLPHENILQPQNKGVSQSEAVSKGNYSGPRRVGACLPPYHRRTQGPPLRGVSKWRLHLVPCPVKLESTFGTTSSRLTPRQLILLQGVSHPG